MFGIVKYGKRTNKKELDAKGVALNNCDLWESNNIILYYSKLSLFKNFIKDADNELVVLVKGRLDNRDELINYLNISNDVSKISNALLINYAYSKWGESCVDYIIGDWLILVWNEKSKKLFIARDHHGISSLFYYKDSESFIFSDNIENILSLKQINFDVDLNKLKKKIFGINEHDASTFYKDLYRLPPAHFLTLDVKNRLFIKQYWDLENLSKLNYKNEDEYYSHFKEIFKQAVKCRLANNKKTGSLLSGGLDSCSISAVATLLLKEQQKNLFAFTSVPQYDFAKYIKQNQIGDETANVNLLHKEYPNIVSKFTNSKDINPVEIVKEMLAVFHEPMLTASNYFWITDILSVAKAHNISTMLVGQGGNHTISWPPKLDGFNNQKLKNSNIFFKNSGLYKKIKLNYNIHTSLLNSKFIFDSDFKKELLDYEFNQQFNSNSLSNEHRMKLIKSGASKTGDLLNQLGNAFGIELRDPTYDKRILEFCIAIPEDIFSKNNNYRLLIRESMKNILPEELLENTRRGIQSADLPARLFQFRDYIFEEISQLKMSKKVNMIVNVSKLEDMASYIFMDKYRNRALSYSRTLLSGIMTANFLKQFD